MGYPLLVGLRTVPLAQVTEQVGSYKAAYEQANHPAPMDVSLRVPVYIAETKEAAINEPETSFMRQTARLRSQLTGPTSELSASDVKIRAERLKSLESITWEDVRREKVIVGTPEMIIEQLKELQEALHVTEVVAEFNAGEQIPPERIERSLRLFCEKVIPAFK
jgi:alkanesulfonate monooxygenase SsuD/methylene tetrahydromethanopterin reductase-like flavin-dependent oxidoreductase (luciferase family)